MAEKRDYPPHIYDFIRVEVATSYIKHELRKLFWRVTEDCWQTIDNDVDDWMNSPLLATPRDFWNGFHGICMGFKLKIGLLYFITAENVIWKKEEIPTRNLTFGIEFPPTRVVKSGIPSAQEVAEFYANPKNRKIREKEEKLSESLSKETAPRDEDPIIVTEKITNGRNILSVYEGNRRLIKAILEERKIITAFVGRFASKENKPRNYWIPTTILMEILHFTEEAFRREDKQLFQHHMEVLKNMLTKSESAVYELKERALTRKQPFRNEVLKALDLT